MVKSVTKEEPSQWKDVNGNEIDPSTRKEYKVKYRWSYHNKYIRPIKQENTAIIWVMDFAEEHNTANMKELRTILCHILADMDAFDALDPYRGRVDAKSALLVDRKREAAFIGIPQRLNGMSEGEALAALVRKLRRVEFPEASTLPSQQEMAIGLEGLSVYDVCVSSGLLKDSFVMHNDDLHVDLSNSKSALQYYGPDISLYSYFMTHYKDWLKLPAVMGMLMFGIRSWYPDSSGVYCLEVVYGFFLAVWSTLFVETWKRQIATLVDEYKMESYEVNMDAIERQQLKQILAYIKSDDKGKLPKASKTMKEKAMREYLHPTLGLFAGTSIVGGTIYALNALQDIVDRDDNWPGMWKMAPFALYIVVMIVLEEVYNRIAVVLTDLEGHRVPKEAVKSLAMKKTLFAYLNMFGYPLYVAFYQQNLSELRNFIFITVSVKQILLGTVVEMMPMFMAKSKPKHVSDLISNDEWVEAMKQEYDSPKADIFMEYSEMMMDFGFLVLFSQCCEWIALWSLIHTMLETGTDQMKFRMQRRFFGQSFLDARDLAGCFEAASLLGVVTSASYFIIVCPARWTLWILGVEHCVLFFKLYLSMMIPDEPEEVYLRRMKKLE